MRSEFKAKIIPTDKNNFERWVIKKPDGEFYAAGIYTNKKEMASILTAQEVEHLKTLWGYGRGMIEIYVQCPGCGLWEIPIHNSDCCSGACQRDFYE